LTVEKLINTGVSLGEFKRKKATSLRGLEKWPFLLLIRSRRRNRWEIDGY